MTPPSDSGDGHQSIRKNGHDQQQDKAIRDLHDEFRTHIQDEEDHHHKIERIIDALSAEMSKYIYAGRVAWAFIGLLGAVVLIYQSSLQARISDIDSRLDGLTAKQHAFEERGTRWGEDLDVSVSEIRNDIREIRNAISGHSAHKGK